MRPLAALALAALMAFPAIGFSEERAAKASSSAALCSQAHREIDSHFAELETIYKHLHSHPELSYEESATAGYLAKHLEGGDFQITRNVAGNGFVAILKNGVGPTVLVRTEMDALPVDEKTGLPYASKVQSRDRNGNVVGVMHACGHDVHMTCWLGTAHTLASMKDHWHGTIVFVAQPAEEAGMGAHMLLKAGLYDKFPRPDYCLALHCDAQQPCGSVAYTPGLAMANIDMIDITIKGKGGHGAWPHMTIDPVVLSARVILDLQTLVSRENNPTDPLVLTIGTIHGGVKANVIPNEVKLQLTVRSTKEASRERVLKGIERIVKADALGAGAPEPLINIRANWYTPAVINDPNLLEKTVSIFRESLGEDHVKQRPPMMGGEDFALYGRAGVPSFLYFLGTQPPEKIADAESHCDADVAPLHSDRFAPVVEPTLKTGTFTMSMAVLNLLGKTQYVSASAAPRPGNGIVPAGIGSLGAGSAAKLKVR